LSGKDLTSQDLRRHEGYADREIIFSVQGTPLKNREKRIMGVSSFSRR